MPLRRSERIKKCANTTVVSTGNSLTTDYIADKSWCSCGGCDDGRLMLRCDRRIVGCCVWYHYDCVGLLLSDGLQLGASKDSFVCPHCSTANSDDVDSHVIAPVVNDYSFTPDVDFHWGDITGKQFCDLITSAYEEVVHWKHNVFMIPFVKAGKAFVRELAKLYHAFADHSAFHSML